MQQRIIALGIALLFLATMAGTAQAGKLPLVTGKHWTKATQGEKVSYLLGMGTIIELEKEYQGEKPLKDSLNSKLVQGLSDHTFKEIKDHVDAYYKEHPEKLDVPVVEVIWYELVAPDLKEASGQ